MLYVRSLARFPLLFALALPQLAHAETTLKQRLDLFRVNPKAAMSAIPEKKGRGRSVPLFPQSSVKSRDFVAMKNKYRKSRRRGRAEITSDDDAANLVDDPANLEKNLAKMDERGLTTGAVTDQPWSDYYWALYNGNLAFRFADPSFPSTSMDWKDKNDYLHNLEAAAPATDLLSPAEKYDLLVGDSEKSLTNFSLGLGKRYYDSRGTVESWMGICHGWSPAAMMVPRPSHSVQALAADGTTKITFYPSDIKALSSLLWANSPGETRLIGGRCNTKNPQTDENGRITDPECFDTNPGTWHQAVVNMIGVNKRSFVLDVTFDYEVWNQPAKGYHYRYFNPKTLTPADNLKDATVAIGDMTTDKFAKYRSPKAKFVVGVSMTFDYIVETYPKAAESDEAANDAIRETSYEYDLELDENMNIVGGEWYLNAHPDFLWAPAAGAKALTVGDEGLSGSWSAEASLPAEWRTAAPAAAKAGSPLATVVNALVERARAGKP